MAALPLILAVGSTLVSAGIKDTQSKIEADQAEVAASQQELQVAQRESDRKDRLASSLATQNAMAGARGVAAFEGSPLTILEDSMERERTATERDRFSTQLSTMAIRSGAKIRRKVQQTSSALNLAQRGGQLAQSGFGGG